MVSGTHVPGAPYNPGRTERREKLGIRPPVLLLHFSQLGT